MARKKQGNQPTSGSFPFARKKEWHHLSKIIEKSDYDDLEKRSLKVAQEAGYQPSKEPREVFGKKFFRSSDGGDQPTYFAKLRGFLKFHLKYPEYDSGIAIFYPFTPVKTVVGCELAAAHFLQMQFAEKDVEVMDYLVREKQLYHGNIFIRKLFWFLTSHFACCRKKRLWLRRTARKFP
jgi:hypothetical protein